MAYDPNVFDPVVAVIDGRRHASWRVTEGDVGTSDSFQIKGLPLFFTIVLFEASLEIAGTAGTISPVITLDPADAMEKVVENLTPATYIRNDCSVHVFAPRGILTIKTNPDTGVATKVYTRLTIMEGYR